MLWEKRFPLEMRFAAKGWVPYRLYEYLFGKMANVNLDFQSRSSCFSDVVRRESRWRRSKAGELLVDSHSQKSSICGSVFIFGTP